MKETFLKTLRLLRVNWRALLLFELVYRAVLVALVGPVYKLALDGAMRLEGFDYLTHENVGDFLSRPPVVIVAVLVILCIAVYELIDVASLHYILMCSERGERAFALDAMSFATRQLARTFRPNRLPLLLLTLLLVPVLSIGVIWGLVFSLETPELFFEHMSRYTTYITIGCIGVVVSIVLLFRLMFTFAYAFFDDEPFIGAVRKSWRAGRHHSIGDLLSVLLMQILVWVAVFVVLALVGVPVSFLLPSNIAGIHVSRATLVSMFVVVPAAVIAGLLTNTPTSIATVLARLSLRDDDVPQPAVPEPPVASTHRTVFRVAAVCVAVLCLGWGAHHAWTTSLGLIWEYSHDDHIVTVTGHRGGGARAPENTLAAFQKAKEDLADSCELDVQMSKDGVIFVSHDSDFHRISGVDKAAWELTYDEIRKLDATGEKWEGKFEKQHYPTLDEVLDWAEKEDMHMNIELKPTGHETNFEQAVVDILHAHDFTNCIVTSQMYDTVANVKKCDPSLYCVYIARFLYGDVSKMKEIDVLSVEENSVKPELVAKALASGKSILTWTVNSPRGVERAVLNGTDDIISDDVPMAREVVRQMGNDWRERLEEQQ